MSVAGAAGRGARARAAARRAWARLLEDRGARVGLDRPAPAERLAAVAAASRAGLSAADAWAEAEPDGPAVRLAADGAPTWPPGRGPVAWGGGARTSAALRGEVEAAGRVAFASGVPLAEVLDALVLVERSREEASLACEVAVAGPAASARVLVWLPAAGLGLAALVEPGALRLVVATAFGWALLALAGALTWAGRAWMRKLTADAAAEAPS